MAGVRPIVLVVDDDRRLRHLVRVVLEADGCVVADADDGDQLLSMVHLQRPDVVLLDLAMPRVSGLAALRLLRAAGEEVPVVMLSGTTEDAAMVAAFDAGADDYVCKPFSPRVLAARLRAVARRARRPTAEAAGEGAIALDPATHEAHVDGRQVVLSPTEYQLLRMLVAGRGRAFSTAELLHAVWGDGYVGQGEIVRANIYRLRRKLEPRPDEPRYILGRRGVGYRVSS